MVEDISSHSLSADGSAVAFRRKDGWRIAATRAGGGEVALDLSAARVPVDPRRDWAEMLQNAWRLDRAVFFSPVMNGSDWQAVHDAYARLWPMIGSEQDFLYLLGQMQGEIASSHTFIAASPAAGAPRPAGTPLLGADYALDPASRRYRIACAHCGHWFSSSFRTFLGSGRKSAIEHEANVKNRPD